MTRDRLGNPEATRKHSVSAHNQGKDKGKHVIEQAIYIPPLRH